MSAFDTAAEKMNSVVGPFAQKVANSKSITALTQGFMYTMPITLGVAVIAVLVNLPFAGWSNFLQSTGLYTAGTEVVSLTLSLLAIYVVGAIGFCFTRNEGQDGMIGSVMSMGSFLVLMPILNLTDEAGSAVSALKTSYMGSDGIFVAFIIGLLIPRLYCFLMKKNLVLKLHSTVPPMVSISMAPTFVSMIIFALMFCVKFLCTLTPYGDIFTLVSTLIGTPITKIGSSPLALILVFFLMNLVWFFGIHPNAILMPYYPVLMAAGLANQEAFLSGKALPYLTFAVVGAVLQIGGAGNTLGLCIATLFGKSEKYKAMRKVVIPANIFNINEPIIFGFPIVLNPVYLVPMLLTPVLNGVVGIVASKILPFAVNPTISMPWVTPGIATTLLTGGFMLALTWVVCLLVDFIVYLPFFIIDDKNAQKLEAELAAEEEKAAEEAEALELAESAA